VITGDVLTSFVFEGTVSTEEGVPLSDVEICFLATGLDQWRANKAEAICLGASDSDGRVAAEFEYFWGRKHRPNRPQTTREGRKSFTVLLRRAGFLEERLEFDLSTLVRTVDGTVVPLDAVLKNAP
jgi:hypothetical protein